MIPENHLLRRIKKVLMTNLPFEISQKELEDLYYQRWEIEKKYHTLKNKMKIESVTEKSTIYVEQDFRAQVLVYNMIQDIRKEADDKVSVKVRKKLQLSYAHKRKYCYRFI